MSKNALLLAVFSGILILVIAITVWAFFGMGENRSKNKIWFTDYSAITLEFDFRAGQDMYLEPNILPSYAKRYPVELLESEIEILIQKKGKRTNDLAVLLQTEMDDFNEVEILPERPLKSLYSNTTPATKELFTLLFTDIETLVSDRKIYHNIARPRQINLSIDPVIETPDTPSYPSLHAARLQVVAEMLEMLLPSQNDITEMNQSIDAATERPVLGGISTSLDVAHGRELAKEYVEALMNDPEFVYLVNVAKTEWQDGIPVPGPIGDLIAPDLIVDTPSILETPQGFVFSGVVRNVGNKTTPSMFDVAIEIDHFGDGSIDKTFYTPQDSLLQGQADVITYFSPIQFTGDHAFRFSVNPNKTFTEEKIINNHSKWVPFIVR